MKGKKACQEKLYYGFSLEGAVPQDDFYRKMEKAVDLSWVGPKVAHRYSDIGRPSVDPEVIVKIELIGYLEGITSERRLMREVGDRLSLRRYLGYTIDEPVPDHSTLSRARDLLGRELFQAVFDYSVRLCQQAGMVGGVHVSGDRSLIQANASLDSLEPRLVPFSPRDFLERLYAQNPGPGTPAGAVTFLSERSEYPSVLPANGEGGLGPSRATGGEEGARWETAHRPRPARGHPGLSNATHVSASDPEATLVARPRLGPMLAYSVEVWSDARAGVITHADAFPGTAPEQASVLSSLGRQRSELGLGLATMAYDKGCGLGRLYRQLAAFGIVAFVPHQQYVNTTSGPGLFGVADFAYDAQHDLYHCPAGCELKRHPQLRVNWPSVSYVYQAKPSDCKACPLRGRCTKATRYRTLQVSIYQAEYEAMDRRLQGPGARLAALARRTGPELRYAEGKQWQGLKRAKYRGLHKAKGQVLLTAAAQNLKKYIKWMRRTTKGAGRARLVIPTPLV